jgi:hypothetical protein
VGILFLALEVHLESREVAGIQQEGRREDHQILAEVLQSLAAHHQLAQVVLLFLQNLGEALLLEIHLVEIQNLLAVADHRPQQPDHLSRLAILDPLVSIYQLPLVEPPEHLQVQTGRDAQTGQTVEGLRRYN